MQTHAVCLKAQTLIFNVSTLFFITRVENLEKKVKVDSGETPEVVYELRQKLENVRNKLEVSKKCANSLQGVEFETGQTCPKFG